MNILLINHYAGSVRHGMEFRPYYLAREWVKSGHNVQIVAASFSHIRADQPEMSGAAQKSEVIDGIDYRWYRAPSHAGNGAGRKCRGKACSDLSNGGIYFPVLPQGSARPQVCIWSGQIGIRGF